MSAKEVNSALELLDIKVQTVLDLTAQGIADEAKRLCPVGTYTTGQVGGRLRGSISWSDESKAHDYEKGGQGTGSTSSDKVDNSPNRDTRYIGTNVDYAPHVEFGTGGRGEGTTKTGFAAILERSEKIKSGKGGQVAQPYLRPAAKQGNRILKQVLSQVKGITGSIK